MEPWQWLTGKLYSFRENPSFSWWHVWKFGQVSHESSFCDSPSEASNETKQHPPELQWWKIYPIHPRSSIFPSIFNRKYPLLPIVARLIVCETIGSNFERTSRFVWDGSPYRSQFPAMLRWLLQQTPLVFPLFDVSCCHGKKALPGPCPMVFSCSLMAFPTEMPRLWLDNFSLTKRWLRPPNFCHEKTTSWLDTFCTMMFGHFLGLYPTANLWIWIALDLDKPVRIFQPWRHRLSDWWCIFLFSLGWWVWYTILRIIKIHIETLP